MRLSLRPCATDKLTDESEFLTQAELLVSETDNNKDTDKLEDSLVSATRNAPCVTPTAVFGIGRVFIIAPPVCHRYSASSLIAVFCQVRASSFAGAHYRYALPIYDPGYPKDALCKRFPGIREAVSER